jgi:hypothetical protein
LEWLVDGTGGGVAPSCFPKVCSVNIPAGSYELKDNNFYYFSDEMFWLQVTA